MSQFLIPDPEARKAIETVVHAGSEMCWTCRSCINECPVNLATGRLQPLKIVRLANLGLLEELIQSPEIWYCLTCNRCNYVCPMLVKPADLILYAREEAKRNEVISYEDLKTYRDLLFRFQRARWHLARRCQNGTEIDAQIVRSRWERWLDEPVEIPKETISITASCGALLPRRSAADGYSPSACFTCSECSNNCPIFSGREVFDPMWIFRMTNLGLFEELLASPSLWLCIACQRCTRNCSQAIEGHHVIRRLQEMAVERGYVEKGFPYRWDLAGKYLFPRFLEEVDRILKSS